MLYNKHYVAFHCKKYKSKTQKRKREAKKLTFYLFRSTFYPLIRSVDPLRIRFRILT
jgi:hypothetical protein